MGQSRRAVVTGAGRGLGRAMALGLAEAGHRVLIVDRDADVVEEAAASHDRLHGCVADLSTSGGLDAVFEAADGELGGLDVLVNNAGVSQDSIRADFLERPIDFDEIDEARYRLFFEVNAIAPVLLAARAARRFREAGWGRIVNVTTSLDTMLRRGFAPYGGTKASIEAHSAIMAQDLAGTGVTANVIIPGGPADTRMIPEGTGFDRSKLIRPDRMVPPLLWLIDDRDAPPNGLRLIAATWDPDHPERAMPIGWPPSESVTIWPEGKA